jgi:RND family efflux transporter MFP subunit
VAEAEAARAARETRLAELKSGARPQEIAEALAVLATRQARLAELRQGARPQELKQAEADVREARAVRDNARIDFERMDRLAGEGIVAAQARDTARTALDVAGEKLAHAQERLALVREGPRAEEISRAAAEVRQAEATLALVREGPRAEEIDRAAAELRQAEAALQVARAGEIEVTLTRQKLATLQANVARDRAALRAAETQLGYTVIRAPFSGVVVAKAAQPGEMISPNSAGGGYTRTGIGTIVDMDSLEIQVDVNEAFINRVTPGQPVEATLNAYPDWKLPASVIAIVPTADRSKATVKVRIAIKDRDPRIVPDMGVRVGFLGAPPAGAGAPSGVLVPASAVRGDGAAAHVFVHADDKVASRPVTAGPLVGADRQVLRGLAAGERVVVEPPGSLRDGDRVRLAAADR